MDTKLLQLIATLKDIPQEAVMEMPINQWTVAQFQIGKLASEAIAYLELIREKEGEGG